MSTEYVLYNPLCAWTRTKRFLHHPWKRPPFHLLGTAHSERWAPDLSGGIAPEAGHCPVSASPLPGRRWRGEGEEWMRWRVRWEAWEQKWTTEMLYTDTCVISLQCTCVHPPTKFSSIHHTDTTHHHTDTTHIHVHVHCTWCTCTCTLYMMYMYMYMHCMYVHLVDVPNTRCVWSASLGLCYLSSAIKHRYYDVVSSVHTWSHTFSCMRGHRFQSLLS